MEKIIRWHHLLILLAALTSCRTEDEVTRDSKVFEKNFQVFTSKNGESVNYPRGYKLLLEKYDSIHATAYTKKTLLKNKRLGKVISEEFVELNIRSQELMMKNDSERWILYPVVKGKEVIGIEVGILKSNETALEFWRMDSKDAYYKDIIDLFRLAYTQKLMNEGMANRGGGCGWNEESPCNTGEVVITVPKPGGPKGDPNLYLPGQGGGGSDPGVIGGGCGVYENCGGGGNPDNPNNSDDPCEKTKEKLANQKNKDIINDLKNHIANGAKAGEKGWRDNKTGPPTQAIQSGDHSVNFGDVSTMNGGYHNHTGTGVNIFSASDISTLIEIARYQDIGNTGNAYMVMIAPGGIQYVMYFNGTHNDIPTFGSYNTEQLKNLNDKQWTDYLNSVGDSSIPLYQKLEQIFSSTLKKMGLQNKVILQRVEEDAKISTINQNSDGTTTPLPCSN